MLSDGIRAKLQNIVRGELVQGQTDTCTTTRNFLCQSFGTSPTVKGDSNKSFLQETAGRAII
jgi:hypothetical protein